jgi:hypothetical protein
VWREGDEEKVLTVDSVASACHENDEK